MALITRTRRKDRPRLRPWMGQNIFLDSNDNDRPGRFVPDAWQEEIIDSIDDDSLRQVTLMIFSQGGKTLIETGSKFHNIDVLRRPAMFVTSSDRMLRRHIKNRIKPLIASCPAAAKKILLTRDGNVSMDGIDYIGGGYIPFTTPQAKGGLKNHPAQLVWCDEVEEYVSLADASNPLDMARQRGQSFRIFKLVASSTPRLRGSSLIALEYDRGDGRRYHTRCQGTGDWVKWIFRNGTSDVMAANSVREVHPGEWRLFCPDCGEVIDEDLRRALICAGRWIPERPEVEGHRSYQISQLYSMTSTIAETFADYNPDSLMGFFTQKMAEPYESTEVDAVDPDRLSLLWRREAPAEWGRPRCRTMGVDTQHDRVEYTVRDWYGSGYRPRSRTLMHRAAWKDDEGWEGVFKRMSAIMDELRPDMAFWDVGTNEGGSMVKRHLARYVGRRYRRGRVVGIKATGVSDSNKWPTQPPIHGEYRFGDGQLKADRTLAIYSDVLKVLAVPKLDAATRAEEPEILLGDPSDFTDDYLLQLSAERLDREARPGGIEKLRWINIRKRNEALDCHIMAEGAMLYLGPDYLSHGGYYPVIT